jgi:hypothetical protein
MSHTLFSTVGAIMMIRLRCAESDIELSRVLGMFMNASSISSDCMYERLVQMLADPLFNSMCEVSPPKNSVNQLMWCLES